MSNRPQKARIWHSFDRLYNCHSTPDSNHYRNPPHPRPTILFMYHNQLCCFFLLLCTRPWASLFREMNARSTRRRRRCRSTLYQHTNSEKQWGKNWKQKTHPNQPTHHPPSTTMMGSIKSHASAMRIEILRPPFQRPDTHTHKLANDGKGVIGIHCLALIVPGNVTCKFFFPSDTAKMNRTTDTVLWSG